MNQITLDNKTYIPISVSPPNACKGCAAENSSKLCSELPDCSRHFRGNDVIFVEVVDNDEN